MNLLWCVVLKFALVCGVNDQSICTPKMTAYTIWHNHMSICSRSNSHDPPPQNIYPKPLAINLHKSYGSPLSKTHTHVLDTRSTFVLRVNIPRPSNVSTIHTFEEWHTSTYPSQLATRDQQERWDSHYLKFDGLWSTPRCIRSSSFGCTSRC